MEHPGIDVPRISSSALMGFDWMDDRMRGLTNGNDNDFEAENPWAKVSQIEQSDCKNFVTLLNQVVFSQVRYADFSQPFHPG
jgi:hypothetical protein